RANRIGLSRQRNEIDVVSGLEITIDVCRLAFIDGFERPEGFIILEDNDCCPDGGFLSRPWENRGKRSPEFFEAAADPADLRLTRISNEKKMPGADAQPF